MPRKRSANKFEVDFFFPPVSDFVDLIGSHPLTASSPSACRLFAIIASGDGFEDREDFSAFITNLRTGEEVARAQIFIISREYLSQACSQLYTHLIVFPMVLPAKTVPH